MAKSTKLNNSRKPYISISKDANDMRYIPQKGHTKNKRDINSYNNGHIFAICSIMMKYFKKLDDSIDVFLKKKIYIREIYISDIKNRISMELFGLAYIYIWSRVAYGNPPPHLPP